MEEKLQTVVVGDSRVRRIRECWPQEHPGRVDWRVKSGATMEEILKMLEEAKKELEKVDLVVLVGLVCDIYKVSTSTMPEWPAPKKVVRLDPSVGQGEKYPAWIGVKEEVKRVEKEIERSWQGVEVLWVLPYPFDCKRFAAFKSRAGVGEMPEGVSSSLDWTTYRGVRHIRAIEPVIRELKGRDWVVSWFPYWKSVGDKGGSFKSFMDRAAEQRTAGNICPRATADGVHPEREVTEPLVRVILDVMRRVTRVARRRLPLGAAASTTSNSPPGAASLALSKEVAKLDKREEEKEQEEREERVRKMKERMDALNMEEREKEEENVEEIPRQDSEEDGDEWEGARAEVGASCIQYVSKYPCGHWSPVIIPTELIMCPVCGTWWRLAGEGGDDGIERVSMRNYSMVTDVTEFYKA